MIKASDEQIIETYVSTKNISKASRLLMVSRHSIYRRLKKLNITIIKSHPITDQQIIDTYGQTGSVWETGKALGLSGQKIHSRLKKAKIKVEKLSDEQVAGAYKWTGSLSKAATLLGVSNATVGNRIKKLGIKKVPERLSQEELDAIKSKIKEKDLTIMWVAKQVGMTPNGLSQFLIGDRIYPGKAEELRKFLGMT